MGANELTGATVGATAARQEFGYDGSGVGVVIIDSGVSASHHDLSGTNGASRVVRFVDFINDQKQAYDDYGHGTHVAGIIAGNGSDSGGARAGIAPAARLVVLKVLDGSGQGNISDVIAALDYAVEHRDELNIGVINLSVATGVYESYETDPLTVAARRAVNAGIVVVTAAGNNGKNAQGITSYAGVTAPGNAPWVLTVGASSHMGSTDRSDDAIAAFSARGPAAIDFGAKPDILAPGVGIESLANAGQPAVYNRWSVPARRHGSGPVSSLFEPERHEHVGAGRGWHRRADAASQPVAHAQCRESDPAILSGTEHEARPSDAGRRISQRFGRNRARALLRSAFGGLSPPRRTGTNS